MDNSITVLADFENLRFSEAPRMALGCTTVEHHPSEQTTLSQFWPILKIYDFRKRLGWLLVALLWNSTLQNGPQYHTFALFLKIYDFRTPPAAAPPPVAPPPLRRPSAVAPPPLRRRPAAATTLQDGQEYHSFGRF